MSQNESNVNNQDTSFAFGTDILGRYFCNTLEEAAKSNEAKPFDVVVIGSGMYGSYIASKLYHWSKNKKQLGEEKRLKILILEAGPYIVHEHIENLPPKTGIFDENIDHPHMKSPYVCHVRRAGMGEEFFGEVKKHSYCVGGKSLTWGKWSPRLTDEDLASWPKELRDFLYENYKKVEDETGVSDYSDLINGTLFKGLKKFLEEKLNSPDLNHLKLKDPPVAVAANSTRSGVYSPDAFSSLGRLLQNIRIESQYDDVPKPNDPIWKSKSIFLVPNTFVYKLETDKGSVSRIHVVDSNSQKTSSFELLSNCEVILAGTAVESTRLVLNSFPRSDSLKENQELIGRNLMGHLFSAVTVRIKREALGFLKEDVLESALYHLQGYSERFKKSYHFQFLCSSDPGFDVFTTLYKMFYDYEELVDTLGSQDQEWVTLLIFTVSEVQGKPKAPLYTEGSNWMNLSKDQIEVFGEVKYAKPYLKWESSPEDEEFWDEVHSTLFDFLSSLVSFGAIEYQDPNDAKKWTPEKPTQFDPYQKTEAFWNSRHESGTLWMGENPDESVTDLDGKLHHIQNVYCADQAIFPTVGSANPVLTGLTLCRKIADSIIKRHISSEFVEEEDADSIIERHISSKFVEEEDFEILYRGDFKSDGWKFLESNKSGAKNFFDIKDSLPILGAGVSDKDVKMGALCYTRKKFKNFILKLEWKAFAIEANSGIFLRRPEPKGESFYDNLIEVQIDETAYDYKKKIYGSPLHKTGAVYDIFPAQRWATKVISPRNSEHPGYWNSCEITVQDNTIEVKLNDKIVSAGTFSESVNLEGFIALQCHTEVVQFRNIRIKEQP